MTCTDKPFLLYKEQYQRLVDKGISCSTSEEKTIIIRKGYFNLVNGYKKPFVNGKNRNGEHLYFPDTSVHKLYKVMKFDKKLSSLLMKNITHIEEEIRTITAHQFAKINQPLGLQWNNKDAYDDKEDIQEIKELIGKIKKEINLAYRNNNEYVKHYKGKNSILPVWVMIKVIRFTTFIRFIELSKKDLKLFLSKLYKIEHNSKKNDFKVLIGALQWIRKVRNSCAHNERIMFIKDEDKIVKTKLHEQLSRSYTNPWRTKQLIDLLVYLKYFNRKVEYTNLINRTTDYLEEIRIEVGDQVFERIRAGMGIKNMTHLKILKMKKKTIDFLSIN
jgi:abortive infection bacteriophage resistance protein